jgi:hypothetical protein
VGINKSMAPFLPALSKKVDSNEESSVHSSKTTLDQIRDSIHEPSKTHVIAVDDDTTVRQLRGDINNRMTKIQTLQQMENQIPERILIKFQHRPLLLCG